MSQSQNQNDDGSGRLAKIITALSGVSIFGVTFLDNPQGFVVGSVIDWALGFLLGVAGEVAFIIQDTIYGTLVDVVVSAGSVAVSPFSTAGDVVLDIIGTVDATVASLAASAGPFGFLVVVLGWVFVAALAALTVETLRRLLLWLT